MKTMHFPHWLLAGACLTLSACAAAPPPLPAVPLAETAAAAAPAIENGTKAIAPVPSLTAPAQVAGIAKLGGRAFAGATVTAYLVGGSDAAIASGTTAADGTFTLDLDQDTRPGDLVRVLVTSGDKGVAAILTAQAQAKAGYVLTAVTQASIDKSTTLIVLMYERQLALTAKKLRAVNDRALKDLSGVVADAVAKADAAIEKLGVRFENALVLEITGHARSAGLPTALGQQLVTLATTELNGLLNGFHEMNRLLAATGDKEAQQALDKPQPIDLGNGVKVAAPDAAPAAPATTTTSSSGGGGSGGGGSGGSGGSSSTNTTADPEATRTVTVSGSLVAPAGPVAAPNLTGLAVHFRGGATVFDLTFSQPVFGWEDASLYVFAANASPSLVALPTEAPSLTDAIEHLGKSTQRSVRGDVDPRIIHVVVADYLSLSFLPVGKPVVSVRVKTGLTNQDGTALGTNTASFTLP
ncbi:MAG: hypothetical protein JWM80_1066 [Cyanobacteria bacterium RYN_339]|nr:hypothetical protein [Cyanobacteria bacterium RYN_339]